MVSLPFPRSRRSRRAFVAAATLVLAGTAASCTEDPTGTPSPVCREGSASIIVFQGPSGRCIAQTKMVGYRCEGAAPQIVIDAGSARERRYLGGSFATQVQALPEGAQILGVGDGSQVVTMPGRDVLYTVSGTESWKWLPLPAAGQVRRGGPAATMIGDSILFAGQGAIASTLTEWDIAYDASNGRSTFSGVAIAQAGVRASDDVVVVELGTNDRSVTAFRDHARQIMASLEDVPLVLWQTVKAPPEVTDVEEINTAIRQLVASRDNLALADWASLVDEADLSYDGVHPSLGNQDAMARIVAPMLRQWWSAITSSETGCSA